jgi:hypothetical protein
MHRVQQMRRNRSAEPQILQDILSSFGQKDKRQLTQSPSRLIVVGLPAFLQGKTVESTLNGTAQLAPVPLPGAAILFGSGLAGLLLRRARKVVS